MAILGDHDAFRQNIIREIGYGLCHRICRLAETDEVKFPVASFTIDGADLFDTLFDEPIGVYRLQYGMKDVRGYLLTEIIFHRRGTLTRGF